MPVTFFFSFLSLSCSGFRRKETNLRNCILSAGLWLLFLHAFFISVIKTGRRKVLCESIGYIAYNSLPFVFKITASISITVILDIENFPSCFLLNFPSIRIHQHINCVWFISTVKDITIYDVYSAIYVLVGQCDLLGAAMIRHLVLYPCAIQLE